MTAAAPMIFHEATVENQHLHAESNILVLVQTRKNREQKRGSGSRNSDGAKGQETKQKEECEHKRHSL